MTAQRSAGLLIALTFTTAAPAVSQERGIGDDADDFFDDVLFVWSAPFNASLRDLHGLALVAGLAGGGLLVDGPVQRWLDTHTQSLPVMHKQR